MHVSIHGEMMMLWWTGATQDTELLEIQYILQGVAGRTRHLGQATPPDILYVHCELLHLNFVNAICLEINFDLIWFGTSWANTRKMKHLQMQNMMIKPKYTLMQDYNNNEILINT